MRFIPCIQRYNKGITISGKFVMLGEEISVGENRCAEAAFVGELNDLGEIISQ